MSHPLEFLLLSAAASIAGILILHFAARPTVEQEREFRSLKVAGIIAGGLLMVLPFVLWRWLLAGSSAAGALSPLDLLFLAGYLCVVFFWFIWKVNSCTFREPLAFANPWEENWGAMYSPGLKKRILGFVFAQLEKEGRIGSLVVDIGSGAAPASKSLEAKPGRKFIFIDIAAANAISAQEQTLRLDVRKISRPRSHAYRKALARAARFLKLDLRTETRAEHADLMIFSDILNYVDFRQVIGGFAKFLKPGGRIVIINLPTRGIQSLFSEKGLKDNHDLYQYLQERHFQIEFKDFPCRPGGETDESCEMIVLVAEKMNPLPNP